MAVKIMYIIVSICSALATLIPTGIALIYQIKSRIKAKTELEKQKANEDILRLANELVAQVESTYKDVDRILKQAGSSAGEIKKDSVMTKLQSYAIDKGYSFDTKEWSEKVDNIVSLTKVVNAKD